MSAKKKQTVKKKTYEDGIRKALAVVQEDLDAWESTLAHSTICDRSECRATINALESAIRHVKERC